VRVSVDRSSQLHRLALHDVAPHDVAPHDVAPHDVAPHDVALQLVPLQLVPLHEVALHPGETQTNDDHEVAPHDVDDHEVAVHGIPRTSISPSIRSGTPSPFGSAYTRNEPRLWCSDPSPVDGISPTFAGAHRNLPLRAARTAPAASTSPAPPCERYVDDLKVVPSSVAFATSGVIHGSAWYISAATPETIAAACDVPVPFK
jgi:hypothetical protein